VTLLHLEEQNNLLRIIQDLPAERQQLIILKFVEHLSNAEIGQIMGRTEGAVKSLYHRTLLSLRVEMETFTNSDMVDDEGTDEC
jgi:RNA polymerase sigma-70 factor (ECF subfamily)